MKEYPLVSVIWEDHSMFSRRELPQDDDISNYIRPTLTFGLLYKKTRKYIVVAQNIDRYGTHDEVDFMIIHKPSILGLQEYGKIKIERLDKGE